MEFNDSVVREDVDPVITKAAYVLFFRRVSDAPRTLESLRASDDRCREDSLLMKELLSSLAECQGECAVDAVHRVKGHAGAAVTDITGGVSLMPINQLGDDASSDADSSGDGGRDAFFYSL